MKSLFPNVAIIGLGLIGGSIALELKKRGLVKKVLGVARSRENRREALRRKAVDAVFDQPGDFLRKADLVIIATPVASILPLLRRVRPYLKPGAWAMDVGSVKNSIVKKAARMKGVNFIGGHPIAGTEHSGMKAAQLGLFKTRNWILTPAPGTPRAALQKIKRWIEAFGARVVLLSPKVHDRIFAAVSHLPNVVAYSLANAVGAFKDPEMKRLAGSSLKDMTRVAASPPEMWRDICLANRTELLAMISRFEKELGALKEGIRRQNAQGLFRRFQKGRESRNRLVSS